MTPFNFLQKQCHRNEQYYCTSFYDPKTALWEYIIRGINLTARPDSFLIQLKSFLVQLGLRTRPQRPITSLETLYDAIAAPLRCTEFVSDEESRKVKGQARVCGWKSKGEADSQNGAKSLGLVDSSEHKKQRKEAEAHLIESNRKMGGESIVIDGEAEVRGVRKRKRVGGKEEVGDVVSVSSENRLKKQKMAKDINQKNSEREKKAIMDMPTFLKKVLRHSISAPFIPRFSNHFPFHKTHTTSFFSFSSLFFTLLPRISHILLSPTHSSPTI